MHRDIGGIQGGDGVQRTLEAVHRVGGEARDQVHVNGLEACVHRFPVGPHHIGSFVGTAAGTEHMVLHCLGVNAHSIRTVFPNDPELIFIQCIRSAAFYGKFYAAT